MKTERLFGICAIVTALVLLVLGAGCTDDREGYDELAVTDGIGRFSLEYPRRWQVTIVDTRDDYTDVRLIAPSVKVQEARIPSSVFSLFIYWPDEDRPDGASALENSIDYWGTQDDFELIDRSVVEIAGIQAERIRFTENQGTDFYRITEPEPRVAQELYFDYGGLIWSISISSILSHAENDSPHIDHLLETFKILD